jgi:squalene synthase HpnC
MSSDIQSSLLASDAASGWAALPPEYAIPRNPPSLAEARAYCERLAKQHYENFSVATWFLPEKLRPHFYSIYAYCRISDDLGDEVADPLQSLAMLKEWERELDACYAGSPRHPVFVALRPTILACGIPRDPFANLLTAFRQDQTVTRYNTFDDLLGYCVNSANPVGRLVLYACGYSDPERQRLSDFTCTGLQLANFWQDVVVDYAKGRIYLPLDDLKQHGVAEADIAARRFSPMFRELMRFEVERAREWFVSGRPLLRSVDRELAIDIELFSRGGEEILNCIARRDYDVLRARPVISKVRKFALVATTAMKALWNRL